MFKHFRKYFDLFLYLILKCVYSHSYTGFLQLVYIYNIFSFYCLYLWHALRILVFKKKVYYPECVRCYLIDFGRIIQILS